MSSIEDFFCDEQILITGGTGFVGSLLIIKLLYSCPKLKNIILLLRRKKNEPLESRKNELFNGEIFQKLKHDNPSSLEKVIFIEGDCEHSQLGLTHVNNFFITQHVTIIFHCAANVKFDEDLKTAINVNVFGAQEILNLAKNVKNLKALVYVSTSYSNCHHPIIEEKYYEPNVHYKTLLNLTNTDFLNAYEKHILGDVNSTYFYSKAAAEQVVFEKGKGLPIAIFRPSAIISTWKEPIPGWTNKAFAPTALVKGIILGIFSSISCTNNVIIDMVPGDLTVNALIAVAWDTNNRFNKGELKEPRFYNYVSMTDNPRTLKEFMSTIYQMTLKKPYSKSIWYPALYMHHTSLGNYLGSLFRPRFAVFCLQAYNFLTLNSSKNIRLKNVCKSYDLLMSSIENVIRKPQIYTNSNIRELWNDMNENDKQIFLFDLKELPWSDYLKPYYDGILQFLLKEKNNDLQKAKQHLKKLRIISYLTEAMINAAGILILYYIYLIYKTY